MTKMDDMREAKFEERPEAARAHFGYWVNRYLSRMYAAALHTGRRDRRSGVSRLLHRANGAAVDDDDTADHALRMLPVGFGEDDRHSRPLQICHRFGQRLRQRRRHAFEQLVAQGVRSRVVSMPSWDLFERETQAYRDSVLPPGVSARLAIEQASTFGWERYVGTGGAMIGMHTFGASAPLKALQQEFGFTADKVVAAALAQLRRAGA